MTTRRLHGSAASASADAAPTEPIAEFAGLTPCEQYVGVLQRHVTAVRRAMGATPGTGGSAGLAWLERSAARVVFPDLRAARTVL